MRRARIYRLDRDRKATLVAQANEGDATRLLESRATGLIAATGNLGKILRLRSGPRSRRAGSNRRCTMRERSRGGDGWRWRGERQGVSRSKRGREIRRGPMPPGAIGRSRSTDPARSSMITSPNARYIQWRAEIGSGRAPPSLDSVTIAYLPQNTPPVVRSINVTAQRPAALRKQPHRRRALGSYSITVTDTGDAASRRGNAVANAGARAAGQQIQISWQADDPDGDQLIYSLYFRGEDEREWKLLRANMTENTYLLDGDVLADGRYYFRVMASDRPSNPADLAREAELVSAPVLIDNTPPVVTASASASQRSGSRNRSRRRGSRLGACAAASIRSTRGPWCPVEAADGVTDSARERFQHPPRRICRRASTWW